MLSSCNSRPAISIFEQSYATYDQLQRSRNAGALLPLTRTHDSETKKQRLHIPNTEQGKYRWLIAVIQTDYPTLMTVKLW